MEILTIRNLTFAYPAESLPALHNLSLSVWAGEFFVLLGTSGCGKTTLLRQCKPCLTPHGQQTGQILFAGKPFAALTEREAASRIGFVQQSPDHQIVTDKVWHELAFGMESLGWDTPTIRRRTAEMASFFGIQNWFDRDVSTLSGGQKQLLVLASVMTLQPELLILDEPTAQLDPIAAGEFLATLQKINRELGTTILLTEHRLEEVLPLATQAAVLDHGTLLCCGPVAEIGQTLRETRHDMVSAMPAAMQIWSSVPSNLPCPVSVQEGRAFLNAYTAGKPTLPLRPVSMPAAGETRLAVREVWFRYEKDAPDILCGTSLTVHAGELLCLLGGNGTGKTTLLKLLAGLKRPYRGTIETHGTVCLLPQNPQVLFSKKTVWEDLNDLPTATDTPRQQAERIRRCIRLCRLSGLENRHPYDLSGGEQQRAALAKLLLLQPDILLLDEPTKGLDATFQNTFAEILQNLLQTGVCIVMVSHDLEFCARHAHRCALFFHGEIVTEAPAREFFAGNRFYTTSANRIAREWIPDAITPEDVITAIGGSLPQRHAAQPMDEQDPPLQPVNPDAPSPKRPDRLPRWRKIGGALFALLALGLFLHAVRTEQLADMLGPGGITPLGRDQLILYGALLLCLALAVALTMRRSHSPSLCRPPSESRTLSRRTLLSIVFVVILIPLTLWYGVVYRRQTHYYLLACVVLLEAMLPFFLVFEGRHPKARELVLISVLCSLGIAGRAAFFMLPQFKPVLALTILSGVALGGETGFLVGSVTMLVSNILFSQGPWTPWQMFATGIIGFLAGVLYQKGWLRRTRLSLCIFGALCAIVLYGGIMNPAAALIWGGEALNWPILFSYMVAGFPMDCVHAAATALFLWILTDPMLEKLDRVKVKYGLLN